MTAPRTRTRTMPSGYQFTEYWSDVKQRWVSKREMDTDVAAETNDRTYADAAMHRLHVIEAEMLLESQVAAGRLRRVVVVEDGQTKTYYEPVDEQPDQD